MKLTLELSPEGKYVFEADINNDTTLAELRDLVDNLEIINPRPTLSKRDWLFAQNDGAKIPRKTEAGMSLKDIIHGGTIKAFLLESTDEFVLGKIEAFEQKNKEQIDTMKAAVAKAGENLITASNPPPKLNAPNPEFSYSTGPSFDEFEEKPLDEKKEKLDEKLQKKFQFPWSVSVTKRRPTPDFVRFGIELIEAPFVRICGVNEVYTSVEVTSNEQYGKSFSMGFKKTDIEASLAIPMGVASASAGGFFSTTNRDELERIEVGQQVHFIARHEIRKATASIREIKFSKGFQDHEEPNRRFGGKSERFQNQRGNGSFGWKNFRFCRRIRTIRCNRIRAWWKSPSSVNDGQN